MFVHTPTAAVANLLQKISQAHRLDFESPDPDPRFGMDMLLTRGPGRMLGVSLSPCGRARGVEWCMGAQYSLDMPAATALHRCCQRCSIAV